jgi:hypothetical protein
MAYTDIDKPTDYFDTLIYSGNGNNPRTLSGLDFQPDWVWQKNRTDSNGHTLADSVRGANKTLSSDGAGAEVTDKNDGHLDAFTSDGFTVGAGSSSDARVNDGSHTYVAWNWKAGGSASNNTDGNTTTSVSVNQDAGFSIMKYAGDGNDSTIGHGLGAKPEYIIFKEIDGAESWRVHSIYTPNNASNTLALNLNDAAFSQSNWISAISNTTISIGTDSSFNTDGNNYIAYAFAPKQGYSKIGSYTGNGNADGSFVYLGFKPAWVLVKNTDDSDDWTIWDNKREDYAPGNPNESILVPNASDAELDATARAVDFLSNGFKLRTNNTEINTTAEVYIYIAFAENPLVTSTGVPATAR